MLRRHTALVLFAWTVLAWPAAATAPAAGSATAAFSVTIEGTQRTTIVAVRRGVDDLGCTVTRRDDQRQLLTFSTREAGRATVSLPRGVASARVRVAVHASGASTRRRTFSGEAPECDLDPQVVVGDCEAAAVPGTAVVRLAGAGTVAVRGALARRGAARCSPSAAPARPFLAASQGHFPASLLRDRRTARLVLRGDARFTDTLRDGASRITVVRWTVVLRRLS